MSKHAEGPWYYNNDTELIQTQSVDQDLGRQAVIAELFPDPLTTQTQQEANARLIAAAPDLLDACKTAIQQCTTLLVSQGWNERWDSITGGEWAGPVITNIMQSADAAIAEAEGGQQ